MSIAIEIRNLLRSGIRRVGELEIQADIYGYPYVLCHYLDAELATESAFGGLDLYEGPDAARDLSTYAEDGTYRFAKGQTNLKRGWVMALENEEDIRQALDHFYPAAVGLELARRRGTLEVENLRDKLNRQTGMYRFARTISDEGAQRLVQEVCGPAHQCARKILWKIDGQTPLDDSEASRYNGVPGNSPETAAIPLLCREACNHFVAQCRKAAKAEFEAKSASDA
jgi:4Fe-4S iron-sulfur cluster binding domain/DR2241 stabilising domain